MQQRRLPPSCTVAGLRTSAMLMLATAIAGCPVALPGNQQVSFRCRSSEQCASRQICRDEQCVPVTSLVDASIPPSDAADSDRRGIDAARPDATIADVARDALPRDHGVRDRTGDAAIGDQGRADALAERPPAPDATPEDGASHDAAQPDSWRPDSAMPDGCIPPSGPAWWGPAYATRYPLTVSAAATAYTLELALSGASAAAVHGASQASGNDLRVVWHAGGAREIDRELTTFGSDTVIVHFRVQESGGFADDSHDYYLYVGNPAPASALANLRNVYLFFEGFDGMSLGSDGSTLFTPRASGDWSVVDEGAGRAYRVNSAVRSAAEIDGLVVRDAVFAASVKYRTVNSSTPGFTSLAFHCADAVPVSFTCLGGALHDEYDQTGISSWNGGAYSGFDGTPDTFSPEADVWYHLQVSFIGDTATFYLDGSPRKTSTLALPGQRLALVGVGADAVFDDVIIRKLSNPEPTVTLGAAQQRCQ